MCQAFSCLINKHGSTTWKLGIDSHDDLIKIAGYTDDTSDPQRMKFARVEITPKNGDYLYPDKWVLKVDHRRKPEWWTTMHHDLCMKAKTQWLRQLNKILVKKKIINPFTDLPMVKKPTQKHIQLLKEWASVGDSVWDSVGDSVWDSVGDSVWGSVGYSVGASVRGSVWASVRDSVRGSVWASVRISVRDSVGDSVRAYVSSFFKLEKWKYIKHKPGKNPFQPCIDLWEMGIVPSYDGTHWRLHSGPTAKTIYKIHKNKIKPKMQGG